MNIIELKIFALTAKMRKEMFSLSNEGKIVMIWANYNSLQEMLLFNRHEEDKIRERNRLN